MKSGTPRTASDKAISLI